MKLWLGFFFGFIVIGLTLTTPLLVQAKKFKTTCKSYELKTKNCYIKFKPYSLQLTKKKITVHDGVWRSIFDFPFISDKSQWHKAIFQKKEGRYFLNLYVWADPECLLVSVERVTRKTHDFAGFGYIS